MDPSEFRRRAEILRQVAGQIERREVPMDTGWNLTGLSPARLREVADKIENAPGARQRDLLARHLLLHPEELRAATAEELQVVKAYVQARTWEEMRETDTAMFNTLDDAIRKLERFILER